MKRLFRLLMVLPCLTTAPVFADASESSAPTSVESARTTDPELWTALKRIHLRAIYGERLRKTFVATMGFTGTGVVLQAISYVYPKQVASLRPPLTPAALGAIFFGVTTGALAVVHARRFKDRAGWQTKLSPAALDATVISKEAFEHLSDFLKLPLMAQYQAASEDREMHDYLIALDAWFMDGLMTEAPPIKRAAGE